MTAKTLSIIIPVFNEEKTIGRIIQAVERVDLGNIKKEIIIVDDGSTDQTPALLKNWEQKYAVLRHSRNQGKGAAIKTALPYIHGDYVIIQDADLELDPEDWPLMIKALENERVDAVFGSRNLGDSGRGYFRYYHYYFGGRLLTFLINLFFGAKLTDINTGYKLFKTGVLKSLDLKSRRFEFCEEVTIKLLKNGYIIKEVPIHYYPRTFKEGKKTSAKDGLIGIWTIVKNIF